MNKIVTRHLGLMPFLLEDIEFLQNSLSAAINAVASIFGDNSDFGNNYVLSGCNFSESGNKTKISEGWLFVNGELVYSPEQELDGDIPNWGAVKILKEEKEERTFEFADSSGEKNHAVWEFKKAKWVSAEEFDDDDTIKFARWINKEFLKMQSDVRKLKYADEVFQKYIPQKCAVSIKKRGSSFMFGRIILYASEKIKLTMDCPKGIAPYGKTVLFSDSKGQITITENNSGSFLDIDYDNTGNERLLLPIQYSRY